MDRITIKTLRIAVATLNRLAGNPTEVWTRQTDGSNKAHVGSYVLDAAYGGYRLCQIVGDGGGERDITGRGTARETYNAIHAFRAGLLSDK